MDPKQIMENLSYFHPFILKSRVKKELQLLNKFPDFERIYSEISSTCEDDTTSWYKTSLTLTKGVEDEIISENDLDELLFRLIEDDLLNSYLFKLDSFNIYTNDLESLSEVLNSWNAPKQNVLLKNVTNKETDSNFRICGYRINTNNNTELASIRILLLDNGYVRVLRKDKEHKMVFPSIIELDFENNLLHIRIKDVDNIRNNDEKISTYQGRIENTLDFISNLKPTIKFSHIYDIRNSLFKIEENILLPKRNIANKKLELFKDEIESFAKLVNQQFNPPEDKITSYEYISHSVLSIISTTIDFNELGEIVGIRFRNTREEETNKYAEVYINDRESKCISTNELYWLNLPILLEQRKVEFLKIGKSFQSGFVIFNLEYSLNTANLRLLKRSRYHDDEIDRQPNDEKYMDVVRFLLPFLNL